MITLADISALVNNLGDMSGDALTSLAAKFGNIPQSLAVGKQSCFVKAVASVAWGTDVTIATVGTNPVIIDSIVLMANTAQPAGFVSGGIFGGAAKVITFISAALAVLANLNAIDAQLAWTGAVRLAVGKTIVISLVGAGAVATDLTVSITYHPSSAGGVLA